MNRTKPQTTSVRRSAIRCAIYTRKSTEDGLEQEFNSLDAQREAGENYIRSQVHEGWEIVPDHYDDGGFTGGNMDRPALRRLLDDIAAGKIECVVVYKVDRLSRSLLDFTRIMEVFDKQSVSFVSVTQQFNTTHSMGRLTLNILLSFAQFEREIISERIRDKIAAQRRKGKWYGGIPVLGYDVDRTSPSAKLVVNEQEAIQVRKIFSLYLELGSLTPVIEDLESRDWRTKLWRTKKGQQRGGRSFDKGALYSLLTNPLYVGSIKHKSERFEGEHPAIIEKEIFDQVQRQLNKNGRGKGNRLINKYGALLKGLVYCKACGYAMVHTFTSRQSKRYRYYTCCKAIKQGWKSCPTKSVPAGELENVVVEQIRCIAEDRSLVDDVYVQACTEHRSELAQLKEQSEQLEHQLARDHSQITRLATRRDPTSATTSTIADLHERIASNEQLLRETRDRQEELDSQQISHQEVLDAFRDFGKIWNVLSAYERAKIVSLLVARVEFDVSDSTVSISFHPSAIKSLAEGAA
ncbi:MAG: recombinase family protein [Pirellula sp.]